MFVDQFDTPKAFQLVIEALLDRGDFEASMALLIQWVGQAAWTPLEAGDASFALLAERWLRSLEAKQRTDGGDVFPRVMAFLERLEANAEEFWHAPRFEAGMLPFDNDEDFDDELDEEFDEDSDDDEDNPFGAEENEFEGYSPEDDDEEEFVDEFADSFEDSTDDGMESRRLRSRCDDQPGARVRIETARSAARVSANGGPVVEAQCWCGVGRVPTPLLSRNGRSTASASARGGVKRAAAVRNSSNCWTRCRNMKSPAPAATMPP